jgi:hypothetical protein
MKNKPILLSLAVIGALVLGGCAKKGPVAAQKEAPIKAAVQTHRNESIPRGDSNADLFLSQIQPNGNPNLLDKPIEKLKDCLEEQKSNITIKDEKSSVEMYFFINQSDPAKCEECRKLLAKARLYGKRIAKKEKLFLWEVCRYPYEKDKKDCVEILKWWTDSDNNHEIVYWSLRHAPYAVKAGLYTKEEVFEIIKPIALKSCYPELREQAIWAVYELYQRESLPFLREILHNEVENRQISDLSRAKPLYWAARFLDEQGEYEYAFLYLMNARIWELSARKRDPRAVPFLQAALQDDHYLDRLYAAVWLSEYPDHSNDVFAILVEFLQKTRASVSFSETGIRQARVAAVHALSNLKDDRAIAVLKEELSFADNNSYQSDEINKAIAKLEKGGNHGK